MGIPTRDADVQRHTSVAHDIGRRSFLTGSALAVTGLSLATPFQALLARPAGAVSLPYSPDYGQLVLTQDETTGLNLLLLPEGFRYMSFGWTGDVMRDGTPTPGAHDGMAVVANRGPRLVLVRNHELSGNGTPFTPAELTYDPHARGGTTNLSFNTLQGEWLESWVSLSGTSTNCAGGPTPWGSWLTCEETVVGPAANNTFTQTHGWIFEVPAYTHAHPVPLKDMGRFVHEAVAVDPVTGYVYETEDNTPSGFYRFIPTDYGELRHGGALQMLKVAGQSQMSLMTGIHVGSTFDITWVDIHDPERPHSPGTTDGRGVFMQGFQRIFPSKKL